MSKQIRLKSSSTIVSPLFSLTEPVPLEEIPILTFAFTILIYAFLTVVQSFATFKSYFYWTSTGNLIQVLTVIGLSFVLRDSLTVNHLAFIVAIGAILNLTYLIIRTRVLTSSNYC